MIIFNMYTNKLSLTKSLKYKENLSLLGIVVIYRKNSPQE